MRNRKASFNVRLLLSLALSVASAGVHAEVVRLDITSREPLGNGRSFGTHGAYEEITGVLHFAVDPADPRNALIVDVELAPRNPEGRVEFAADIVIWKPQDAARGNGVTLIDIPNRGSRPALAFNKPTGDQPLGDGFLMSEGYAVVWIGWEYDLPDPAAIAITVPSVPDESQSAIAGLGFAAVRDAGSWLKHAAAAPFATQHLLSFGLSQSGRFLRNYLYLGFNEDEEGRAVFDGMLPHIAGASRIDLNRRGAEPVSQGQYSATAFPFTDAAYTDPVSGAVEGLLANRRAEAQPRIFYTNSGVEYWGGGRVAALTHTLPDGTADIPLQDNVRLYFLAGTQHGPGAFPPAEGGNGQQRGNPLDYWWHLRALLSALKDWVVAGIEPPASKYPRLADMTLVPLSDVDFPALPQVHAVSALTAGNRAANPMLLNAGGAGAPLPLLVPQVDADGNDIAGIRHPELAVPLATYTGWNFTDPERGDPDTLFPLAGSWIPFAATETQRSLNGDPRPSIASRYPDRMDYLARVQRAGEALVSERYLLADDVGPILERARRQWDLLVEE